MTDLRKAAEMALEWMAATHHTAMTTYSDDNYEKHCKVEKELRQALAQSEQEPYCWVQSKLSQGMFYKEKPRRIHTIPLYTAPPSKPWVSLTGDEIDDIAAESGFGYINVARAVEAKLKEKNNG